MQKFQLLETMRLSAEGAVYLLDRHLARLHESAAHFGFHCDLASLRERIVRAAADSEKPSRVRLLLSLTGECDLEFGPLSVDDLPRRLELSLLRVDSEDPFLYHKTTNRVIYEKARAGCDRYTDVILINEREEVTETTIANIAVLRKGKWITPPVSSGLLPGLMRAELMEKGKLEEGVIRCDQLAAGETIRCFNSVRGIFELPAP